MAKKWLWVRKGATMFAVNFAKLWPIFKTPSPTDSAVYSKTDVTDTIFNMLLH